MQVYDPVRPVAAGSYCIWHGVCSPRARYCSMIITPGTPQVEVPGLGFIATLTGEERERSGERERHQYIFPDTPHGILMARAVWDLGFRQRERERERERGRGRQRKGDIERERERKFRVQGLGFKVEGLELRVWGVGFRV